MRQQLGKDKILKAALALFVKQGFHTTSISDIAYKADVSKGLLYNYYVSKDALLVALMEQASQDMFKTAALMIETGPYEQRLDRSLRQFFSALKKNKNYLSFQLSLFVQPSLKKLVNKTLQKRIAYITSLAEDMFQSGGAKQPEALARRYICELDGVALHYLSGFSTFSLGEVRHNLFLAYRDIGT